MAIILPTLKSVYCISNVCVRYSYALYLIIPLIIILFFIIRKDFVKFSSKKEQTEYYRIRKTLRLSFIITRSLLFIAILIGISSPFIFKERIVAGEPNLLMLVDNSTSFDIFDHTIANKLFNELSSKIKVEMRHIATGISSAIGDGILNNMQGNDNLLIITDGYNNDGKLLGDVISFASSLNSTIYTVNIKPVKSDVTVRIEGVSQAISDSEEDFHIKVKNIGNEITYTLEVLVDDAMVLSTNGHGSQSYTINKKFSDGFHTITAKLTPNDGDYFAENNIFYKSVKVVERPKILFITEKSSPMQEALNKLYIVETLSALPNELSNYLAVILNDIPVDKLNDKLDILSSYITEGNGLVVIGGQNSFERGKYKGSLFETLLPVKTGVTEESEKSDVNIVLVIDISSGTEDYVAIEKALALSVLDSLGKENNVGAVAFNSEAYQIETIKPLKEHYDALKDKISRLKFDKQSRFDFGVRGGANLLKQVSGSKNIILITDGKTTYDTLKVWTLETVFGLSEKGIKTYVVGVGDGKDNDFLNNVAVAGNGVYFPANADNRLDILFGEANKKKEAEYFNRLIILESTHFITYNISVDASVNGYNLVIPKPHARPLLITNKNIPILITSRFGLGKVVVLATDDGGKWAGELLSKENSRLLTKTINWAIGDLARKKDFNVAIKDTMLGEDTAVSVVSKEPPKSELFFVKTDVNTYSADFIPNSTGYFEILKTKYAVNYPEEYNDLGINQDFHDLVLQTGGEIFEPDDIEKIISTIKRVSKRIKTTEVNYRYIFVISAIILFLLDIGLRRLWENRNMGEK
ncbi:MAG: VWA domain-containing protein [Nanoarchaeota archaeon]